MVKIIDFRNDELLRANGDSLRELADQTVKENKAMLALARRAKADLRTMRIATLVATVFQPITVITVCSLPY